MVLISSSPGPLPEPAGVGGGGTTHDDGNVAFLAGFNDDLDMGHGKGVPPLRGIGIPIIERAKDGRRGGEMPSQLPLHLGGTQSGAGDGGRLQVSGDAGRPCQGRYEGKEGCKDPEAAHGGCRGEVNEPGRKQGKSAS